MKSSLIRAFGYAALIVVIGWAAWTIDERDNRTEAYAKQAAGLTVDQATMTNEQYAALKVMQLGALDWMRICAYEMGRRHVSPEAMNAACSLKLHIGEPAWPRPHPTRRPS